MVIVISNRNVNEGSTDESLFGEDTNAKGIDEIRLAKATLDERSKRWNLELIPEPATPTAENRPSRALFQEVIQGIKDKNYKSNWVFYIHGFNQSFKKTLDASYEIAQKYKVEVIVFSWAANPGGFVTAEYRRARQAAKASSNAIDRALEFLGAYLLDRPQEEIENCNVRLNLLIHSLGNYLVEQFVRSPVFSGETRIFDNIIFHQADVDNRLHKFWMDRVQYGRRLYITINENDRVLKGSDLINPARLGNTSEDLESKRAIYIDFTDGDNVGREHNFFTGNHGNRTIEQFFQRVLTSKRGELVEGFKKKDQETTVFYL
ncbi:alpha/beta hydrolase [Leptolyngbyaceae cyanobacterium CCMR0082]|uniref:Alpha/beta hydrolase n=1 Tax=Adonisia turfae CCMR0082 TaxID=2304604 RepID=A0A6M0S9P5_9CYAN|nr:alpha/beta hydrolase [Adonisia turfae]NEZ65169.1 alpha/beta hydrolase [Adonisia turfae CCMR0082]